MMDCINFEYSIKWAIIIIIIHSLYLVPFSCKLNGKVIGRSYRQKTSALNSKVSPSQAVDITFNAEKIRRGTVEKSFYPIRFLPLNSIDM